MQQTGFIFPERGSDVSNILDLDKSLISDAPRPENPLHSFIVRTQWDKTTTSY